MPAAVNNSTETQTFTFTESPRHADAFVPSCAPPARGSLATTLDILRFCGRCGPNAPAKGPSDADGGFVSLALLSRLLRADSRPPPPPFGATATPRASPPPPPPPPSSSLSFSCLHFMIHSCGETPAELPTLTALSRMLCESDTEANREEAVHVEEVPQEVKDDRIGEWTVSPRKVEPGKESEGPAEVEVQAIDDLNKEIAYSSMVSKEELRAALMRASLRNSPQPEEHNTAAGPWMKTDDTAVYAKEAYAKRFMQHLYFRGPVVVSPSNMINSSSILKNDSEKKKEVSWKKKLTRYSYLDPSRLPPYQAMQRQSVSMRSASSHSTEVREDPKILKYAYDPCQKGTLPNGSKKRKDRLSASSRCFGVEIVENLKPTRCYCDFIHSPPRGVPFSPRREESRTPGGRFAASPSAARFAPPPRVSSGLLKHRPNLRDLTMRDPQQYPPNRHSRRGTNVREKKKIHTLKRNGPGLQVRHVNETTTFDEAQEVNSVVTPINSVSPTERIRVGSRTRVRAPSQRSEPSSVGVGIANFMIEGRSICFPARGLPASMIKNLRCA